MGSFDPADVLGNRRIRPIVGYAGSGCATADGKIKSARYGHGHNLAAQWSQVCPEVREGRIAIRLFRDVRAARGSPESADEIGSDQIGVADRELVIQIVDAKRVDRQRVFPIIGGSDIQVSGRKAPENRVFRALLP